MTTFKPFDVSKYLDNDEVIAEYLTVAAEDPNPDLFLLALSNVAKARGMAEIARETGLGRESLYKSLEAGAHPRYETISAVLKALGVKVAFVPEPAGPSERHLAEKRAAFVAKRRKKARKKLSAGRGKP